MKLKEMVIYHIYPLGFGGSLIENQDSRGIQTFLQMENTLDYLQEMGFNCLYLGPIWESLTHGYDTVDYLKVDKRLGSNEDFKHFVDKAHKMGIKIILDTVFNHISRNHFAFLDVKEKRENSPFCKWFKGINFSSNNPYNDGFDYETWDGHYPLVKLDLTQVAVKDYLKAIVLNWMESFNIDGLRIDAADVMDKQFLKELKEMCMDKSQWFHFISEVVHGDYNGWLLDKADDSVTNYECFKGLYSSLNDKNYFEIDYTLKRQFGEAGQYKHQKMYNFVDNHDVNRVGSTLIKHEHLYPLYLMLFAIPGTPSIYYGSEWGVKGVKAANTDNPLRPKWDHIVHYRDESLESTVKKLIGIRKREEALKSGDYKPLMVGHEQMAFERKFGEEEIICVFNSHPDERGIYIPSKGGRYEDLLNNEIIEWHEHMSVYGNWGRLLKKIR